MNIIRLDTNASNRLDHIWSVYQEFLTKTSKAEVAATLTRAYVDLRWQEIDPRMLQGANK